MELNPLAGVKISSLNNNLTESTNSIGVANVQKFEKSTDILISLANYVPVTMSYDDLKKRNFKVYLNEKIRDFNTVVVSANKFEEYDRNHTVSLKHGVKSVEGHLFAGTGITNINSIKTVKEIVKEIINGM